MKCVYVDLDGTLLGAEASFLRDGDGNFSLLGARALEACARDEDRRAVGTGGIHPITPRMVDFEAYHLGRAGASKVMVVAFHVGVRGYEPKDCVAIGDSREDMGAAEVVRTFWLVANGVERDS